MLRLKFSAQYFLNYWRCQRLKIDKKFFAVSKLIFLTPAVTIGSFSQSPVAHRPTNLNRLEKNNMVRIEYFSSFTFALDSRGFIQWARGFRHIKCEQTRVVENHWKCCRSKYESFLTCFGRISIKIRLKMYREQSERKQNWENLAFGA